VTNWQSYAPLNSPTTAAPPRPSAARNPVARVTIEIFSSNAGDTSVSLWVDKNGPMADTQGDFGTERNQALLRLQALTTREIVSAFGHLAH